MSKSNNNKALRRFIWQICAFGFCSECVFIYSWYAVMFADHGLGAPQISILFAVWSVTAFVLEIPSGGVADKYSRRHILAYAQMAKVLGYICWVVWPSFWGFLAGFVCWGIKGAFFSGTFEALVYDELKSLGAEQHYAKLTGRIGMCANAGILSAAAVSSLLIRWGYATVALASVVPLVVSSVIVLTMRPARIVESTGEAQYLHLLREGVSEAIRNRPVLRLILFLSTGVVFLGVLDEYWPIFYTTAGMPKPMLGIIFAVLTAFQSAGEALAYRFLRVPDRVFYIIYAVCGIILLTASHFMRPWSVACLLAFCFALELIRVAMESRLQHQIRGHARATVTSVNGFLGNVTGVGLYMAFGTAAHKLGYRGGFTSFGAAMVLIGIAYGLSDKRTTTNEPATTETMQEAEVRPPRNAERAGALKLRPCRSRHLLETVNVALGPAAGADPAAFLAVPASIDIPSVPLPLILLIVTVRLDVPLPLTEIVPVAVPVLIRCTLRAVSPTASALAHVTV